MEEATRRTSRRGVLGRGLALAAGALGVGAAAGTAEAATPKAKELRLHGRHFHLQAADHRPGKLPDANARLSAYGELCDRPGGKAAGHFTSAFFALDSPFAGASSLELHTFHLKDGTIHGLGTAARGEAGHFAILGGTGKYAGARGSYVSHLGLREHGGNGTATFHLTLAE